MVKKSKKPWTLADTDYLHECNGFFGPDSFAYEMSKNRSVDIDSDLDFKLAGLLLQENEQKINHSYFT